MRFNLFIVFILIVGFSVAGLSQNRIDISLQTEIGTEGDIIVLDASGFQQYLAIGANATVLTSNGTTASWQAPAFSSFDIADGTTTETINGGNTVTFVNAGTDGFDLLVSATDNVTFSYDWPELTTANVPENAADLLMYYDNSATDYKTSTISNLSAYGNNTVFTAVANAVNATHNVIELDGSTNAVEADLPAAATVPGRIYYIKAEDITNAATVDGNAAETIDGAATYTFASADDAITIQSDGTGWIILNETLNAAAGVTGADNGTSLSGTIVQLGQPAAGAGASTFTADRFIDQSTFDLYFESDASANSLAIDGTSGHVGIFSTPATAATEYELTVTGKIYLADANNGVFIGNEAGRSNTASFITGVGSFVLQSNTGTNNVGVGFSALRNNAGGNSNTAVGSSALRENITGSFNTAMGAGALDDNTASSNTAFGNSSLTVNVGGTRNSALGSGSLLAHTSGDDNTAIGYNSMNGVTSGDDNTTLGSISLENVTTSDSTVAVGYSAGRGTTTHNKNTIVGALAYTGVTAYTNVTAVGFDAEPTASNQIMLGDANVTELVAGTYKFDIDQVVGAGTDNYVLTFDNGDGQISLEPASGGSFTNWVVSDGTTTQTIDDGNTLTFVNAGTDGFDLLVSATDNVTFTYDWPELTTGNVPENATDIMMYYDDSAGDYKTSTISNLAAYGSNTVFTAVANAVDATHNVIELDAGTNAVEADLPAAASVPGRIYYIKAEDITNAATVDGNGAETIDGAATYTFASADDALIIQSDGTNWVILSETNNAGGMTSFTAAGDAGVNQTITDGNTLTFDGINAIQTTGVATDIIQIDLLLDEQVNGVDLSQSASGLAVALDPNELTEVVTLAVGDELIIADVDAGNAVLKTNVQDIIDLASFDITDGTTTETVSNGNTITFVNAGTDGFDLLVSATDNVTFTYDWPELTTGNVPENAADLLMYYDNSATDYKTSTISNLAAYGSNTVFTAVANAVDETHNVIELDASTNAVEADLPAAAGVPGRIYYIKAEDITNAATVDGNAAETIDGAATYTFANADDALIIQSDGTNWIILSELNNGTMASFIVAGDAGANQTITDGNTLTFDGISAIQTTGVATDILQIDLLLDEQATNGIDLSQSGTGLRVDLDINELPTTTTFDTGSDFVAVDDGGVSSKITLQNLLAGSKKEQIFVAHSSATITITGALPTANPQLIEVYVNGVLEYDNALSAAAGDYTVTNATTITLDYTPTSDDILIRWYE